jgi:DNA-binding transcriptional MerR regulator
MKSSWEERKVCTSLRVNSPLDLKVGLRVSNHTMLIGDVARLSDITPATIRYYEELGLLTAPGRSESGYRHYCQTILEELRFIKKGQGLGFSLEEIREILNISRAGEAPCGHVLDLAQRNLAAAEERIRHLQAFRDRLATQIARWKDRSMTTCSADGLCEIISSADLPAKAGH